MHELPPDPLFVIRGDMTPVHCLLFDDTNAEELLYVGTEDGTVHIWDLKACKRKQILRTGEQTCLSLHMVQGNLITQDKTCTLKVWKPTRNFECILSEAFANFSFCRISILLVDESALLAIPQPESVVVIHSFTAGCIRPLQTLEHDDATKKLGEVLHLKMFRLKTNNHVAVLYESGSLIVWDLQGNAITCDEMLSETPMAFDFDVTTMQGVCGAAEKNVVVFRMDESLKITKRKTLQITNPGIGSLCVRSDGKILAAGCWDGKIRVFSWKTCKLLAALDCHRESILHVCFAEFPLTTWNNCKQVLAAASSDKRISLWNIYN